MDAREIKAAHLALHGEVMSDEEAKNIAEAMGRHRKLCYGHRVQELDKLPYVHRHRANFWRTVDRGECDLCQGPQQDIERPSGPLEPFN